MKPLKLAHRGDSTVTAPVPNGSLMLSNIAHGWFPDDHVGKSNLSNHVPLVFSSSPLIFVGSISAREIYYKETRFVLRTAGFFLSCPPSLQFRGEKTSVVTVLNWDFIQYFEKNQLSQDPQKVLNTCFGDVVVKTLAW
ncbi:hypothetical protein M8J77_015137 [Diaphorina citri]|nr:hypothetical protein M8J77_015137 [Diaphorina citri]